MTWWYVANIEIKLWLFTTELFALELKFVSGTYKIARRGYGMFYKQDISLSSKNVILGE